VILVDYVCGSCHTVQERWVPSPPATSVPCGCGGAARRQFAPIGLSSGANRLAAPPLPARPKQAPMCSTYPQVPGLCHMSESAGRRWVATYLNDNRRLDRELARQEAAATVQAPTMADAITHHHYTEPAKPTPTT
jgi:hypothetical protein